MGALSLASDFDETLQNHLNELSIRMGRILFGIILCTAIVAYFSASIISWYLNILSPCPATECLRIYKPTDWMATRWMSALLISCVLMLPLLAREIYLFSSRGLLPSERSWLIRLLLFGPLLGIVIVFSTLAWLLPYFYKISDQLGFIEGVVPRYGAVEMIQFALVVTGVELIILFAVLSSLFAITFKLIDKSNVMSWRFRIHAPAFLAMWLLIPLEYEGMFFLCLCTEILVVESLLYFPSKSNIRVQLLPAGRGILDSEARLRRIGIVGCSCCGVVKLPNPESIPSGMVYFELPNFCTSTNSQDMVIEKAFQLKLTDVILTGCDESVISKLVISSLNSLDCKLRTLSLIDFSSLRTLEPTVSDIDFIIKMAVESDPWKEEDAFKRVSQGISKILENVRPSTAYWTELEKPPFGTNLSSTEVLITSVREPSDDEISKFSEIGISIKKLHNYLLK